MYADLPVVKISSTCSAASGWLSEFSSVPVKSAVDPGISIATVYRTVRLFEEAGILERHDFGDGRARYEAAPEAHHDHLIDVETGNVIEFVDPELEALQKKIAEKLGFRLVDHRMELYGVSLDRPH